jgi:hypothetical protein
MTKKACGIIAAGFFVMESAIRAKFNIKSCLLEQNVLSLRLLYNK